MDIKELPRIFTFKIDGETCTLSDPQPLWEAREVRNFYAGTYPELANAVISQPEMTDGNLVINFKTEFGTKG